MESLKLQDGRKPRILVVDDEEAVHKMVTAYFKRHDYEIHSCMDSREVVEMVGTVVPDLVLIDLMMPSLDGVSATRRIRNMKLPSYLPVIMLTARSSVKDVVTALEAGVDDYLTKPFEFEELEARIRNMLRLKQLQDSLHSKSDALNQANEQINRLNHVLVDTNRKLQKKIYDFHSIFEVSYNVMGKLELQSLVKDALLNILGIFTAKSAILFLADPDDKETFRIVDAKGFRNRSLRDMTIRRNDKLIHYLELVKKAFQIRQISKDFQDIIPRLQDLDIEVLCPLFRNDETIGLLCIGPNFKEEEYTEDQLETLGILANMLAIAIHNAQLYENIRDMSYTDGMTGLHNYRFFELRMKEEIARARRDGSYISLLILDVDYFKNYNDTLGHPAGDDVLRKVSKILQKSVRDNDIVARYGGEEFAVILSGAEKEGAITLAERIRYMVESADFFKEEIQPDGQLTISLGVASYPDDAIGENELIQKADKALYQAKNDGRNRVVAYTETMSIT